MIKNAKIKSTKLGLDRGVFLSFWLMLDYGGSGQGFGGYTLDAVPKDGRERVPHKIAGHTVKRILEVVGVDSWEELPGKHIRVKKSGEWGSQIEAIGNILDDNWFCPEKEYAELAEAE